MANLLSFITDYRRIELPVRNAVVAEFFVQTVNATFMNILPLFMLRKGFSNSEIALFITMRFIGVLVLAVPLGRLIRGRKLLPLFKLSSFCVPFFGVAIVLCIIYQLKVLTFVSLFLWGASFTFMQIPIFPFILRNALKTNQTAAISLSYSTWSFGGIVSGGLIALFDLINHDVFDEQFILLFFSISGFAGIFFLNRIKINETVEEPQKSLKLQSYDKKDRAMLVKALTPTLIIATGAGLTIPFISLFFEQVHHLEKGGFSVLSFLASLLVAYFALMVPLIKEKVGYKIAIPGTQTLAVIALVAMATTEFYSQYPVALTIAAIFYILRQPLMNMAGPMTSELVLNYAGKRNREITSALTSAIWSGSWVFSGMMVTILTSFNISLANIFLLTALIYSFGIVMYFLLIVDYTNREQNGLIEN